MNVYEPFGSLNDSESHLTPCSAYPPRVTSQSILPERLPAVKVTE